MGGEKVEGEGEVRGGEDDEGFDEDGGCGVGVEEVRVELVSGGIRGEGVVSDVVLGGVGRLSGRKR